MTRKKERVHSDWLRAAIDHLTTGMLIVDAFGTVLEANAAARALLNEGNGFVRSSRRLSAVAPESRARLGALLASVGRIDSDTSVPHSGGVLAIQRGPGRRPLQLRVTPLGIGSSHATHPGANALVLVSDPERLVVAPAAALAEAFGLTPAEARVAEKVARGHSADEISDATGTTRETARTYLKRLMAKVGASRQADLVRLLGAVPPLEHDASRHDRD
jgi:DNA-binding CsgD family transcriptional regulator